MHGVLAPTNDPNFPHSVTVDITDLPKLSLSTPAGYSRTVEPFNAPGMDFDGRIDAAILKLTGKDKEPRIQTLEDMRNQWLVYSEHSVNQGRHAVRFMSSGLAGADSPVSTPTQLFASATGVEPKEGIRKVRNIIFMPLENPMDLPGGYMIPPGTHDPTYQRGLTPDRMARLAFNADPTKAPVDVLTLDAGKFGHAAGMIEVLRKLGILDQYDEIYIDACMDRWGDQVAPSWNLNDQIPETSLFSTLIADENGSISMTHVDPAHAGQIATEAVK
jgi:hypothetical protein